MAAIDIDSKGLAGLAAELKTSRLVTFEADVSKEEQVVDVVARASEALGGVNTLVNNAGIFRDGFLVRRDRGKTIKLSLEKWQAGIDVDLTAPFLMTREVVVDMFKRETRPGIVINISSISRHGNMGQSNYSAAKAGLVADTKLWAAELAAEGIRVVAIAPGFVRTPILEAMRPAILDLMVDEVPLKRIAKPEEIYLGLKFAVECDYFNGKCIDIDGGLSI